MNLNDKPTPDQLRELLRGCDDYAGHHVLWVKRNGDVYLSRLPAGRTPVAFQEDHAEMQLRYDTFLAGNEYVGPEAAADDQWISELFTSLMKEWPEARGKPEVRYIDQY